MELNQRCLVTACILSFLAIVPATTAEDTVSFSRDVRPILSEHCFACHGPDNEHREADLRLDDNSAIEAGVISAGSAEDSELWRRMVSQDADELMPPPHVNKPLDDQQLSIIRKWIESGANFERHWSFIPARRPSLPPKLETATGNEIDAFIQDGLAEFGLKPSPLADRRTLIRRVTLDLTGLPPTPDEVNRFLADHRPDAYERLVDEVMSRRSYGQHMARYWLDLARYADTHGLHLDNERTMWPYRDWVVRAFNNNLPFDQFTRWQLAGDLLKSPTRDQLIASGFNRCNVTTSEGGSINEEWVFRYAVDRTTTTAEVWMGLTAGCAVCHDHKFDPLSTHEYYSLYAFFHSAADPAMDGNKKDTPPILKLPTEAEKQRISELEKLIQADQSQLEATLANIAYEDPANASPVAEATEFESIWFGDSFPDGANVKSDGSPLTIVRKPTGLVLSGEAALQRTAKGLAQDYYSEGASPLSIGGNGRIFVSCYLDPKNPPETIMLQFYSDSWRHRAVWGDETKIPYGDIGTPTKRQVGKLPELGKWVRLEFDAEQVGLTTADQVTGFAFTQYGGTVTWDQLGIVSSVDPANDPTLSFGAWLTKHSQKPPKAWPAPLRSLAKQGKPESWTESQRDQARRYWMLNVYAQLPTEVAERKASIAKQKAEIQEINKNVAFTFVMADLPKPRDSFVMIRGAYDRPGDKVTRRVPSFLPPLQAKPEKQDYNRLDLADWLVSGNHPLTARVTVNRLWQQFFGNGIVLTSADFGSQGTPPTHPELLDWMAVQFVEDGWDVKHFVKRILMSHAYRQSSRASRDMLERDPDNRYLARAPRLRLDAEVLRDQVLYVSGLLVDRFGGPGVNPYQPPNIWEPVGFGGSNTRFYKQGTGDDLYRRSLYTFLKRTAPPPFMSSFDAPNREQSCSRRERTNTPLQALQLMNDVQHFEAARKFAERILKQEESDNERISWAWSAVTSRDPTKEERNVAQQMVNEFRERFRSNAEAAVKLTSYGESKRDDSIEVTELASYTMLANLLFNLDEVINKN